jgi:hypothetical protein
MKSSTPVNPNKNQPPPDEAQAFRRLADRLESIADRLRARADELDEDRFDEQDRLWAERKAAQRP